MRYVPVDGEPNKYVHMDGNVTHTARREESDKLFQQKRHGSTSYVVGSTNARRDRETEDSTSGAEKDSVIIVQSTDPTSN